VGEHRKFKFSVQVDHSKSQPTDDKPSMKGVWSRHVTHFKFLVPLERLKLKTSTFVHWMAIWSSSLRIDKQSLKWSWSRSRHLFKFWEMIDSISEMVQDRHSYSGRLIGNHEWPIKWHNCQWLWIWLKVTFA